MAAGYGAAWCLADAKEKDLTTKTITGFEFAQLLSYIEARDKFDGERTMEVMKEFIKTLLDVLDCPYEIVFFSIVTSLVIA